MNNFNISRVLFILTLFILLSASCSSEKGSNKQASSDEDFNKKSFESITIKGFSLGMDFNKAREQTIKLFEEAGLSKEIATDINPDNTEVLAPRARRGTTAPTISILVYKDNEDKLVTLEMSDLAVNVFFNAAQLSAKEFVKEFAKNCGLPEFRWEIPEKGHYTYWKYESKDGWYIQILDNKALIFGKSPDKKKPDFR